ncbi:pantoate--beta-alanine ligase [Desulfovibrio litoralis]|uniref:Pantothenate synthetase n=1 Tax=Desulfovibrio litoralis DSM 11393 TaxID=1121455 RepID=A0A1M7TF20_9BACT|nr:pantoate--beta-alanine ligase [Desulfovibrio litoralis]SHN69362.1 pantothenate synthetase [Desulfovibrio litoralis DSM 11393]
MQIITNPNEMQSLALSLRSQNKKISLVPTMGFLHAGHAELIKQGRQKGDILIVSLFVNPTQFGVNEDLSAYPQDLDKDMALAKSLGVDILFAPKASDVYANDHATWVEVPDLAKNLCAKSRPTHFRGVATVVCKLLMLTQANVATFGEKDWQQLAIIRRLVRDLNIPVEIAACPIVREADGLALSSRNVYLKTEERKQAPEIQKALLMAKEHILSGERNVEKLKGEIRKHWQDNLTLGQEDYLEFVEPDTLIPVSEVKSFVLMAVAVRLGKARLIDNILVAL